MYITNGRVFGGTPSILIFWLFLANLSISEQTIDSFSLNVGAMDYLNVSLSYYQKIFGVKDVKL